MAGGSWVASKHGSHWILHSGPAHLVPLDSGDSAVKLGAGSRGWGPPDVLSPMGCCNSWEPLRTFLPSFLLT